MLVDGSLLGKVGVSVTPTLIKYTQHGTESWRRIVGSDDDLDRFIRLDTTASASADRA